MSSLRLLLPRSLVPGPRAIRRDIVRIALDDGDTLEVLRVRDPRARKLRLSVDERGARLTLPPRASLVAGERFLEEHRDWLVGQLRLHADYDVAPLAAGRTSALPLRGMETPLAWVPGRYARVAAGDGGLVFQAPETASAASLRRALRDFYEAEARVDLGRWLSRELPGLPRAPSRVRFRAMSSQWGSLAPDDAMSLDLSLVLAAPAAYEYVVIHELCHLIRPDHSPAFWREVEARCPDWRLQRAYFRDEGRRLKARLHALVGACGARR